MERKKTLQYKPLVIVDGDDTLWETAHLYRTAKEDILRLLESTGLDGASWLTSQESINVALTRRMRLSSRQFPESCVRAYDTLCKNLHRQPDPHVRAAILAAARKVFTTPVSVSPSTARALRELGKLATIVLLTKGDLAVQVQRLQETGLSDLLDSIYVVRNEKSKATFEAIIHAYGAHAEESWSIGNSLPSDIAPAAEAGLQCIHLAGRATWAYENRPALIQGTARIHTVSTIADALATLRTELGRHTAPKRGAAEGLA